MANITTRANKGSALTHAEVDANFTGLNNALESIMVTPTVTMTSQAQAEAEFTSTGYSTILMPTAGRYTKIRLTCRVTTASASPNTPVLYPQYSADGTTWTTIGTGSGTEAISLATAGLKATDWLALPAGALGNAIYFRIAMAGGNATASPVARGVCYQFICDN